MSFSENDYAGLLKAISTTAREDSRLLLGEVFNEAMRMLKRVPIYPGIVMSLVPLLVESIAIPDLVEGDRVRVVKDGVEYMGTVEIGIEGAVTLRDAFKCERIEEVTLHSPERVEVLRAKLLERDWPTLLNGDSDNGA
ncbi:hypothetical protein JW905_09975 [bacterium]|nr:hypothetical protein [candidate division CSSED10-310 bacterium]